MKTPLMILLLLAGFSVMAQKNLTENELLAIVKKFHPIARQAALEINIARANVTTSRGAFDPELTYSNGRKEFEAIQYYDQQLTQLKIPTWYGIDITTGLETINGSRINPEETKGTINYIGLSIPVVQNLVIDKRRAILQQAKLLEQQSEVQRRAVVNDLLYEALLAYWDWWAAYNSLRVVQASVQNAKRRFEMVKTTYQLGDRPAIDTLEALTQVQSFEQNESERVINLAKARLQLSLFLWSEGTRAIELPEDAVPAGGGTERQFLLDTLLNAVIVHPALQEYDYKLRGLAIERRLKFQSLLPEVTVKYNQSGRDFSQTFKGAVLQNNYRYGLSFSMPLRLSEGRGGYQAARLKIEQTRLAQTTKALQLQNKVKGFYTEWQQTAVQVSRQKTVVANFAALQRGEEVRFRNGESSLFLMNAREQKTIEAQQKEIQLGAKIEQAKASVLWAAGLFGN